VSLFSFLRRYRTVLIGAVIVLSLAFNALGRRAVANGERLSAIGAVYVPSALSIIITLLVFAFLYPTPAVTPEPGPTRLRRILAAAACWLLAAIVLLWNIAAYGRFVFKIL